MKAAGFRTFRALLPGNAQRFRQSVHSQKNGEAAFLI
jgi:hypothetical protein